MGDCEIDNVAMERHDNRYIFGGVGDSVRDCFGLFSEGARLMISVLCSVIVMIFFVAFAVVVVVFIANISREF